MLYLILIAIFAFSMFAQGKVKRVFMKYTEESASSGITADRMAQDILWRNGISQISIEPVDGVLTDHYDPTTSSVGLSSYVYGRNSVSALAVTAHEIGHVLQYHESYSPLVTRNKILPVASIGSQAAPWIVILGLLFHSYRVAMLGAILFGAVLLFQLITLPVELDASKRGMNFLKEGAYINETQEGEAREVLNAAAMTYVWAAIASLVTFLRLFLMARSTRRR